MAGPGRKGRSPKRTKSIYRLILILLEIDLYISRALVKEYAETFLMNDIGKTIKLSANAQVHFASLLTFCKVLRINGV